MNFEELDFEWDENKNKLNIKNHKIDFESAVTVFLDEHKVEIYDKRHSEYEQRYNVIGMMEGGRALLHVTYTERGKAIRIISARKATKEEREVYLSGYYTL